MRGVKHQLIGKRFGRLMVVAYAGNSRWMCICDCGTEHRPRAADIVAGRIVSCGCQNNDNRKVRKIYDVGYRAGLLTIISCAGKNKWGSMTWKCRCDCGNEVVITAGNVKHTKSCGCLQRRVGKDNPGWKGGRYVDPNGYVRMRVRGTDKDNSRGFVMEHRLVMERMLGRDIKDDERVHHRNGIRSDNSESNLELWVLAHPRGQRSIDVVEFSERMLQRYAPHKLA